MKEKASRHLWILAGSVALGTGAVGILLPLLPTTPLLILAAYCYSRGSQRLHAWLINHRVFGPTIRNWRQQRAISIRAKILAIVSIMLIFTLSILLETPMWALILEGVILTAVAAFLLTRPTPTDSNS